MPHENARRRGSTGLRSSSANPAAAAGAGRAVVGGLTRLLLGVTLVLARGGGGRCRGASHDQSKPDGRGQQETLGRAPVESRSPKGKHYFRPPGPLCRGTQLRAG